MDSGRADDGRLPSVEALIEQARAGLVDEALAYGSLADVGEGDGERSVEESPRTGGGRVESLARRSKRRPAQTPR